MKNILLSTLLLLAAAASFAAEQQGTLRGTIVRRDAAKNRLTVAHEDVPGLMSAMTMPYDVRGQQVASLPPDGTPITAMLHLANDEYWLTDVRADAHAQHDTAAMPPSTHDMHDMHAMTADGTSALLMRQASGVGMNPIAAPMHMAMTTYRGWNLMLHGAGFVSQVVQSGPRGGDKFFSTNWVMGMADRPLGGGRLMLRSMLSLEPLTVGKKYPELFQTGETSGGEAIVDAQHPHDFFMELAAEYAHPLADDTIGYVYAAPFGDPALGPVAYPHRASAAELPQATLGHHVQDSTHVAGSVLTLGVQRGRVGYAVSAFHGQEPDENRWDIDTGALDSWAARVTFDPTPNWSAQISTGHLVHPEAHDAGNVQRTTASVSYSDGVRVDASVIYGQNRGDAHTTRSWLAESVVQFAKGQYVTGRAEIVDKDELFADSHDIHRVKALTLGYTRDVVTTRDLIAALGGNATLYSVPSAIRAEYGSNPHSLYVFVRVRGGAMHR